MNSVFLAAICPMLIQADIKTGDERPDVAVVLRLEREATFGQVAKVLEASEALKVGMTFQKGKANEAIVLITDEVSFDLLQKIAKTVRELGINKIKVKVRGETKLPNIKDNAKEPGS